MNSEVIEKKQLSENVWLVRLGLKKDRIKSGTVASLKVTPKECEAILFDCRNRRYLD
jgi:hypothetical protein